MASYTPEVPGSVPPPPLPPPKPGSHEVSGISTPVGAGGTEAGERAQHNMPGGVASPGIQDIPPDPGSGWLPAMLQDKSKQDIADILASPSLLQALTHSPRAAHPSLAASHDALRAALADNADLAARLADHEARLSHQRAAAQAQLLSAHALERQWRARQSDMDHALAPFAPASLYQRLGQAVGEQAAYCHALEESFLEGDGGDGGDGGEGGEFTTEREVADWVKRYREARGLYYLREERKQRWDEGRVGGWR